MSFKEAIELYAINNENLPADYSSVFCKLGNVCSYEEVNDSVDAALTFRVKSNEYFIPIKGAVNIEEEIEKLKSELAYTEGFFEVSSKEII